MCNSSMSMAYLPIRYELNMKNEYKLLKNIYLHDLQMYTIPPSGYTELVELQQWCVNRLKVLNLVQKISMHNYQEPAKHCLALLIEELENNDLYNFVKLIKVSDYKLQGKERQLLRKHDCISHFVLRSAVCFHYEKSQWFFKHEVLLFRWRISSLNEENIRAFMCINGLQFSIISEKEKQNIRECLEMSSLEITENSDNIKFYKTNFTKVTELVKGRQVFLQDGIAYVPGTKISCLVIAEFEKLLNEGFTYSREMVSNIYDDTRMTNIFDVLSNHIDTTYFKYNKSGQVSIKELDELSQTSYPLCMKLLHDAFKTNHHLPNGGRVQYCLFLKGIGLSLKDALQFWKNEFMKEIDEFTFNKKYKYHIRHLYGEEGKRANYEPFHCAKILNSNIGSRDKHGCPFKHMSFDKLKETLSKCDLVQPDVELLMQLSKQGLYVEACTKYYEIKHNCITENIFNHPNVYFDQSFENFKNMLLDSDVQGIV